MSHLKIKAFEDFKEVFEEIKDKTYAAKLTNDKDVGDFFERLLGKDVDSDQLPDLSEINTELKTGTGKGRTTSFTKTFSGGLTTRKLLYKHGYYSGGIKRLNSTVTTRPNNLGFYLKVKKDRLFLMKNNKELSYWEIGVLIESLAGKMPNLAYIIYEKGKNEVIFKDCTLYKKVNLNNFIKLREENLIVADLRVREGYIDETCSVRDRGTAFKVNSHTIYDYIFEEKEIV